MMNGWLVKIKLNMHSFYSILFLLVVFICSCSDAVDVNRDIKVIPVDFENYESVSMSDLFTKIEVIELEGNSESYLNSPSSLEINNGKIYLKDQHAVYSFDSNGKYLHNTKMRRGRASNEYFSVNDYYVDNENIYIMDHDGSVYVYDSVLNMKERYNVPVSNVIFYKSIANLNNDIFALSGPAGSDTIVWNFYSKSEEKIVGTYFLTGIREGGYSFGLSREYITNDEMTVYRLPDNGYSYYVLNPNSYTVTELFQYNLGKYAFNPSKVDDKKSIASYIDEHKDKQIIAMETQINNKFILCKLGLVESNSDSLPDLISNLKTRLSFYSLESGKHRLINNLFENNKSILGFDYMDDSCLYLFNNYFELNQFLYEESLLDDKSKKILDGVNDETNGLIFKYYFKDNIL